MRFPPFGKGLVVFERAHAVLLARCIAVRKNSRNPARHRGSKNLIAKRATDMDADRRCVAVCVLILLAGAPMSEAAARRLRNA